MNKLQLIRGAEHAIAPTPTTVLTINVQDFAKLSLEVTNQDLSQTLAGEVWRRVSPDGAFSRSGLDPFVSVGPGETVCADFDVSTTLELQFRATASGLGLTCRTAGMMVGP